MSFKRLNLGKKGEQAAVAHLQKKGYAILHKNYRTRCGEIDIIANDRNCLVFAEVKTRSSRSHGSPLDGVTKKKQQQISKVAQQYLCQKNLIDIDARFDVISVYYFTNEQAEIEHIESAFELCYGF